MSAHQIAPQAAAPIAPCVLVIFGGGGDLTQRKLIPAIYHLAQEKLLSDSFAIVGVDRVEFDSASYRSRIDSEIHAFLGDEFSDAQWDALLQRIHYSQGDFADPAAYARLAGVLKGVDAEQQTGGNYLFYLATPPRFFGEIATRLGTAGLAGEEDGHWRRIIIEKPFGQDLASARELNKTLHLAFNAPQIYRIDHYLGTQTVQNILAYRFTNSTVEPIWNRRYIDHVEITVAESLGVQTRAG